MERLEGCKAELIRKMIDVKRRELEDICTESHMSLPPLPYSEAAPDSHTAASAQVPQGSFALTQCYRTSWSEILPAWAPIQNFSFERSAIIHAPQKGPKELRKVVVVG